MKIGQLWNVLTGRESGNGDELGEFNRFGGGGRGLNY